jgi:hypothetical protein
VAPPTRTANHWGYRPRRQDRRREPLPLIGFRVDPRVVDARCDHSTDPALVSTSRGACDPLRTANRRLVSSRSSANRPM